MTWRYALVVVYLVLMVWFTLLNWDWMTTPFLIQVFPGVKAQVALLPLLILFHVLFIVVLDSAYRIYTGMLQRENTSLRIKLQDAEKRDMNQFAREVLERLARIEEKLSGGGS